MCLNQYQSYIGWIGILWKTTFNWNFHYFQSEMAKNRKLPFKWIKLSFSRKIRSQNSWKTRWYWYWRLLTKKCLSWHKLIEINFLVPRKHFRNTQGNLRWVSKTSKRLAKNEFYHHAFWPWKITYTPNIPLNGQTAHYILYSRPL